MTAIPWRFSNSKINKLRLQKERTDEQGSCHEKSATGKSFKKDQILDVFQILL